MKTGLNFQDRNDIRRYVEAGETTSAGEISQRLGIKSSTVQRYMDSLCPPEPVEDEEVEECEIDEDDDEYEEDSAA